MWPADVQQAQLLVNRFVTDLINSVHELNGRQQQQKQQLVNGENCQLKHFSCGPLGFGTSYRTPFGWQNLFRASSKRTLLKNKTGHLWVLLHLLRLELPNKYI